MKTSINIDMEVLEGIDKEAVEQDRSRSNLINKILKKHLESKK